MGSGQRQKELSRTSEWDFVPEAIELDQRLKQHWNDRVAQNALSATSIDRALMWLDSLDESAYSHQVGTALFLINQYGSDHPEVAEVLTDIARDNALELTAYSLHHDEIMPIVESSQLPLDDIGFEYPPSTQDAWRVVLTWDIVRDDATYFAAVKMVTHAMMNQENRESLLRRLAEAKSTNTPIHFVSDSQLPNIDKLDQEVLRKMPDRPRDAA